MEVIYIIIGYIVYQLIGYGFLAYFDKDQRLINWIREGNHTSYSTSIVAMLAVFFWWITETFEPKIAGQVEPEVMLKLADILQILDDEEYTVSVHSNDTIDDKISESIANTAIIDFKKQLKQELLSKISA